MVVSNNEQSYGIKQQTWICVHHSMRLYTQKKKQWLIKYNNHHDGFLENRDETKVKFN